MLCLRHSTIAAKSNMRFIRSSKLSNWCLKVIIENLNRYMYSQTVPQKFIDFLFRVYSEEVFREYSSSNTMTEDRMLWFLNPHSKKITLSTVTEKVVKQIQMVGPTIISLNLYESLASENMLNSILCCIPHVKYLNLRFTAISDNTLLILQRMCPELVSLNLRECIGITDEGMKNLCGNNLSLEYLDVTDTDIEDDGLRAVLYGMPSLQYLKFFNVGDTLCYLHKLDFMSGEYKYIRYNLTELIYEGVTNDSNDALDVILMWSVMCPKVKKIHFEVPVNEEVLHACTRFQHLEEIKIIMTRDINPMRTKDVLAPILPVADNIRTLILDRVKVSTVALIENFKNLNYLYLNDIEFSEFAEEDITTTENKLDTLIIKNINFEFPPITYKATALLISLSKNVTELHLNRLSNVPQEIFQVISDSMKNLAFVDLSYCIVKISSVFFFFQMPSMKKMYLDLCNNCCSYSKDNFLKKFLDQSSPCTLSWRIMIDNSDDSDSDEFSDA